MAATCGPELPEAESIARHGASAAKRVWAYIARARPAWETADIDVDIMRERVVFAAGDAMERPSSEVPMLHIRTHVQGHVIVSSEAAARGIIVAEAKELGRQPQSDQPSDAGSDFTHGDQLHCKAATVGPEGQLEAVSPNFGLQLSKLGDQQPREMISPCR